MMRRRAGVVAIVALFALCAAGTARAAEVKQPREAAAAQGKPGGGVVLRWLDDAFGYAGTAFGGDSAAASCMPTAEPWAT